MATSHQFAQLPPFLQHPDKPSIPLRQWIKVFENHVVAIDAVKFSPARKVAILYGCLGLAAQHVFKNLPSFPPPLGEAGDSEYRDAYKEELARLGKHNDQEPNMLERHNFFRRKQRADETIDEYISELRVLTSTCEFEANPDIYIHDQFVFSCFSRKIQERLLSCRKPTLLEIIDIAKSIERSSITTKALQSEQSVNLVKTSGNETGYCVNAVNITRPTKQFIREGNTSCYRCGSKSHLSNNPMCPAEGKRCVLCKTIGHFQGVCRSAKRTTRVNMNFLRLLMVAQSNYMTYF